jgi:hypothetical protein
VGGCFERPLGAGCDHRGAIHLFSFLLLLTLREFSDRFLSADLIVITDFILSLFSLLSPSRSLSLALFLSLACIYTEHCSAAR